MGSPDPHCVGGGLYGHRPGALDKSWLQTFDLRAQRRLRSALPYTFEFGGSLSLNF
jgi:hypothetical protein